MSKTVKILAICATLFGLSACDPYEELCYSGHPHQGRLMLAWNWPTSNIVGSNENLANERVTVLAVRTLNMIKYAGEMKRPARGQYERYICRSLPLSESSYDEDWGAMAVDNLMHEGTYDLLSFNSQEGNFDVQYKDFFTTNLNYFKNITVTFNTYDRLTDHSSLLPYADFTDFNDYRDPSDPNSGGGYILSHPMEMVYGMKTDVAVRNGGTTYAMFDKMSRVTQNVTFVFDVVKKEEGIAVHEMFGEISGIPNAITLLSNEMPYTHTYRSHFTVSESDMSRWDSFGNKAPLHVETTVPLLGIVRAASEDMHVGPGILQIRLKTWVKDADGNKVPGKTLRAGINLYNILSQTPSVKMLDEEMCRQTTKELRLVIKVPLQITKDKVVPNDDGMEQWEWIDEAVVEV